MEPSAPDPQQAESDIRVNFLRCRHGERGEIPCEFASTLNQISKNVILLNCPFANSMVGIASALQWEVELIRAFSRAEIQSDLSDCTAGHAPTHRNFAHEVTAFLI